MSECASASFTKYGWCVCLWILIVAFHYGYHLSALNQLQAVLTCQKVDTIGIGLDLPTCVPMSDTTFSTVTAMFTVGGLLGSLSSNHIMDRWGRRSAVAVSGAASTIGALLIGGSAALSTLIIGRIFVGFGAGLGICVGPIYLSEITPSNKGKVGVLTQLSIVLGIFLTQALGLRLATPHQWRTVPILAGLLSGIQVICTPLITESPEWLKRKSLKVAQMKAEHKLWTAPPSMLSVEEDDYDPLLSSSPDASIHEQHEAVVTVPQLFLASDLRRPMLIVCFAMISQQLSGINAVLYYSNAILAGTLPDLGPYVSLGVTAVNVVMTFPPIFLIERIGRKSLLRISISGALISLVCVGIGLNTDTKPLSSIAIMTFIMSFAVGLGPVPFVMIPEVSPAHAVSALSSLALSLNWISNFAVSILFLPLRNLLAHGDTRKEGIVFHVFACILLACGLVLMKVYRG